ncbi:enhancer of polycomb homolog 1b isoform X2 [Tachysurus ichikawai]
MEKMSEAEVCRESQITETEEPTTSSAVAKKQKRSLGSFFKGSEATPSATPTLSLQQSLEAEMSSYLVSPMLDSEGNPLDWWRKHHVHFPTLSKEHHLQWAISAQQVYGEKKDSMVIPVPAAESNITYYERLYPGDFKMPKQLIHIQPFSLDTEQPDYDLDSEDEVFVTRLRNMVGALQFEEMLERLEKGSGQQVDPTKY